MTYRVWLPLDTQRAPARGGFVVAARTADHNEPDRKNPLKPVASNCLGEHRSKLAQCRRDSPFEGPHDRDMRAGLFMYYPKFAAMSAVLGLASCDAPVRVLGVAQSGHQCAESADCSPGLFCDPGGACQRLPATPDAGVGLSVPLHLWVVDAQGLTNAELVLLQSLQGLLARGTASIWIRNELYGGSDIFLDDLKTRHNVATDTTDLSSLLASYATQVQTHILCDRIPTTDYDALADKTLVSPVPASVNVATSLANLLGAVVSDPSTESLLQSLGYTKRLDVSGKDEAWVVENYPLDSTFAPGGIVEQSQYEPRYLRDFAIANNYFVFSAAGSSAVRSHAASLLGPAAAFFGWYTPDPNDGGWGENSWISTLSALGSGAVATDKAQNLSTLQQVTEGDLTQLTHYLPAPESGVHYVALVMSDGDNIQFFYNQAADPAEPYWWAAPERGSFNMNWEMSPTLTQVAPSLLRYYQLHATGAQAAVDNGVRDFFIAGPSGHAYAYPSRLPVEQAPAFVDKMAGAVDAGDLHIVTILDSAGDSKAGSMATCADYLGRPEVDAVVYKDYNPYNGLNGAVKYFHNKPCVAYRYLLWDDGGNVNNPTAVAAALNSAPRTDLAAPNDTSPFSLVQVHAWSTWNSPTSTWQGQGAMSAAAALVALLDPSKVRVVTLEAITSMLRGACRDCNDTYTPSAQGAIFSEHVYNAGDMLHAHGVAVTDEPTAWSGHSDSSCDLSQEPPGTVIVDGPYATTTAAGGPHRATFRLKSSTVGASSNGTLVAVLDIFDPKAQFLLARTQVRQSDLQISDGYQDFTVPFYTNISGRPLNYRVSVCSDVDVTASTITVR